MDNYLNRVDAVSLESCLTSKESRAVRRGAVGKVPAKKIEKLSGFKLFPTIPADVADAIKDSADDVKVRVPGSKTRPR